MFDQLNELLTIGSYVWTYKEEPFSFG